MKVYALCNPIMPGIYKSWTVPDNRSVYQRGVAFKTFLTEEEALKWMNEYTLPPLINVKERRFVQELGNLKKRKLEYPLDQCPKKMKSDETCIYVVGVCSNNGKKHAVAGIGVYFKGEEYTNISIRVQGSQNTLRAQLSSVLMALQTIRPDENAIIYSDSDYVINTITGVMRTKGNRDIFESIIAILSNRTGTIAYVKIPLYSSNASNQSAYQLAKKSLKVE